VEQIAFADRILLNKCDLVDSETDLEEVERRIRAINETVPIKRTTNSVVDMDYILGIRGFSLDKIIEMDDAFLEGDHDHQHDSRVSSVGIDVPGEVKMEKLNEFIGWLLKEKGVDLFRSKGVLAVKDEAEVCLSGYSHALRKLTGRNVGGRGGAQVQDDLHRQELEQGRAHQWVHGMHGEVNIRHFVVVASGGAHLSRHGDNCRLLAVLKLHCLDYRGVRLTRNKLFTIDSAPAAALKGCNFVVQG